MAKPKVLLVGTSFSAAPLYFALQRQGYGVEFCGANEHDPCTNYGAPWHRLDYADKDALLDLVRREKYDRICPSCNDYAYLAASHVANTLGLPGFDTLDTTALLANKARFREFMEANDLPAPRARLAREGQMPDLTGLRSPYLIKPTDSFSGRGVTRLEAANQAQGAIAHALAASRQGEALVEEFVSGSLHSHSAFIRDGHIYLDFFVDEFCQAYPYQVDCSNYPSRLPEGLRDKVRDCMGRVVTLLGLCDGLLHTQFIADGDRCQIIECMRRCPGDLYYHLINRGCGADYLAHYVAGFTGDPAPMPPLGPERFWARHTLSLTHPAVVWSVQSKIPSNNVQFYPLSISGAGVSPAPYDKVGILFAEFADAPSLFRITQNLGQYVQLDTTETDHAPVP